MSAEHPEVELATFERTARMASRPWEDFAAGLCTAKEAEARARADGMDSAQIRLAQELYAPLDSRERARFGATLEPALELARARSPRWRAPALTAAFTLVAAAAVFWIVRPTAVSTDAPSMVAHSLTIVNAAELRGSDHEAVPSVPAGSVMQFELRPATRHAVTTRLWACLVAHDRWVPLEVEHASRSVGATIAAQALLPSEVMPGEWELVAVVASVDAQGDASERCRIPADAQHNVVRGRVRVR